MNVFNDQLQSAKRRHRRNVVIYAGCFFCLAGIISALLIWTKSYTLNITPQDAAEEVRLSSVTGRHIIFGRRVFPISSSGLIKVQAPGYHSQDVALNASLTSRYVDIQMTLAPVNLSITPTELLKGPVWTINGEPVSANNTLTFSALPGEYQVRVESLFHQPGQLSLTLEKGKDYAAEMAVTRASGSLAINSVPQAANVRVNGQLVGQTPYQGDLLAGSHTLDVSSPGFAVVEEAFLLTSSESEFVRNYVLKHALKSVTANLSPENGRLYVNGKPQKATAAINVPETGTTTVMYEKPGYESIKKTVTANTREIDIRLKPLYGEVSVNSMPAAKVFIDGAAVGVTPITKKLLAVTHKIKLTRAGYATRTIAVNVVAGGSHSVSEQLTTEKDALLAKSRSRLTNSVGMTLIKFKPGAFLMGAARSQRGQRANELLRHVDFNRQIYISAHEVTADIYSKFKTTTAQGKYPAVGMSWDDAALFCNWLSSREGLPKVYSQSNGRVVGADMTKTGYRLLTEAEWEWAARYANKTSSSIFVWGNGYKVPAKSGNLADESARGSVKIYIPAYTDGFSGVAPVGSFPAEPSGLYDQAGNVSEWVHDYYSLELPVADKNYVDYSGPQSSYSHLVKGSSYLSSHWTQLRASYKEPLESGRIDVGFRVARYIH